jgi:hypothetical protein
LVQSIQKLIPNTQSPGTTCSVVQLVSLIVLNIKGRALSTLICTAAVSSIPRELEESAEIDGASRLQYVFQILLPLMKVPIATVTVLPCHSINPDCDQLREFEAYLAEAQASGRSVPKSLVLKPGDIIAVGQ